MLRIKQFYYPVNGEDESLFDEVTDWSKNIIERQLCYSLHIHSLPGNKFKINGNPIIINNTGTFSMDFGVYPIDDLRIYKNNNYETYQTVIDIVYQQYGGAGV